MTPTKPDTTIWAISIDVTVSGERFPLVYTAKDWAAARKWFAGPEFRKIADRVEFVTFTNREVSDEDEVDAPDRPALTLIRGTGPGRIPGGAA